MTTIRKATSVTTYLGAIFDLFEKWAPTEQKRKETDLWYRGVNNLARCKLVPGSVWRHGYDENGAAAEFETRASGILHREPADPWEWYFLMQHYAMGTRLLDWSESPLVGLYFSLKGAADEKTACVWIMDPRSLNEATMGSYELIAPGGAFTSNWLPEQIESSPKAGKKFHSGGKRYSNRYPLAILPRRKEPRILAQWGAFTVHGTDPSSIDQVMLRKSADTRMARIEFRGADLDKMRRDLDALGIRDSTLFPEREPLARDIVARFTRETS